VLGAPLDVSHGQACIGLKPSAVEVFGHHPELNDEIPREILRLNFPALLLPEAKECSFIAAHDDSGVGAANKATPIQPAEGLGPRRTGECISHLLKLFNDPFWIIRNDPKWVKYVVITIEQIRAGRALLGWSQSKLAEQAGLSLPTVKRVEAGTGPHVSNEARMKLQHALEAGGVDFLPENGGGAGLRLRVRKGRGRSSRRV
jgi:DNA-binding XRE family transcriptional regulator